MFAAAFARESAVTKPSNFSVVKPKNIKVPITVYFANIVIPLNKVL